MKLGVACLIVGFTTIAAGWLFGRAPIAATSLVNVAVVAPTPSTADEDMNDVHALSALVRNGANLAKRATITHYLYLPEIGDARAAADVLERRGFSIVLERPLAATANAGARTDWGIVASRGETPTMDHLRATRAVFKALAGRYHGSYDGWEAEVVR